MLLEQEIGRELFGYKKDDVDRYLADMHRSVRLTREENHDLKEKLEVAKEKIAHYESMTIALKKTMANAEKTADDLVSQAKKEAELILARANKTATKVIQSVSEEKTAVESGYRALEKAESDLEIEIKAMLASYTNLVDAIIAEKYSDDSDEQAEEMTPEVHELDTEAAPAKEPIVLSKFAKKVLDKSLSHLAKIDGVGTVWMFDDMGAILSSVNHLGIDLSEVTESLISLDAWADRFEANLANVTTNLIFIEFNRLLLFINPITDGITTCMLTTVNAPVGQIFKSLDKHVPQLKKALTAE